MGSKVYDITCRYAEKYRNTPEEIGNLLLTTADGVKVPLSAVADIKMALGASTIMREMARRYTLVRINLRGADLSSFVAEADKQIAQHVQFDHEKTNLHWAGQFENRNRAFSRLALVVPLALMVMFILLIFAFGKVRQAGLLMVVVPLALFGGMAALNIRGMTLNVSSAVGFIALIGVAIQNGIIIIECNNPRHLMLPNMYAQVRMQIHSRNSIVVPKKAVLQSDKGRYVLRHVGDNTYVRTCVEVQSIDENYLRVIKGLSEGDVIIKEGAFYLIDKH